MIKLPPINQKIDNPGKLPNDNQLLIDNENTQPFVFER